MNSITPANLQKTARIAHRPRGKLQISTWRSDVSLSSTLYQPPSISSGKVRFSWWVCAILYLCTQIPIGEHRLERSSLAIDLSLRNTLLNEIQAPQ